MINSPAYRVAIAALDVLCVLLLAISFFFRSQRAGIPESFLINHPPSAIVAVDGERVSGEEEIEFCLVTSRIGDTVAVGTISSTGEVEEQVTLVPLNGWLHIVFYSSIAVLFFVLGLAVYRMKPEDPAAILFHLTASCVAVAASASREIVGLHPPLLGTISGALFFLSYNFLPASFLHFMMVFPRSGRRRLRFVPPAMYGLALILAVSEMSVYYPAVAARSVDLFHRAQVVFGVFNGYLLAGFVAGVVRLGLSYRRAETEEEQEKLRWIIAGLTVGTGPYILLWVLPKALFSRYLVSEEIFQAFLLIVPVTFAISIIRHRLMDIDVIIRRGTVYTIVLGFLIGSYLIVVGGLALVIPAPAGVGSVLAAIMTALIFEPVRLRVQRFVDKRFFHVKYDIRETLPKFVEDIKEATDIRSLATMIVERTDELIAPERAGFFTLQESTHRLTLAAHHHFELLERHGVLFEVMKLRTQLRQPVALDELIEPGIGFESADSETFRRWGIAIAFPMLTEKLEIIGFLVLGPKKSGARFTVEDVNLLKVVTTQAGLALERITLQTKILIEQEESRHLAELSQMKSYFVSSVSHDLKTPLSAIRMHAELLHSGHRSSARSKLESLEIIEGECDRLAHLIDNVLDAAKIESGAKQYVFSDLELTEVVRNVLRLMHYELKMRGYVVRAKFPHHPLPIEGDETAIERAIINLVGNAIKYSEGEKHITISTSGTADVAVVSVTDKGIGISGEDLEKIFERYYRSAETKTRLKPGLGLGLSIVKHVMDAHRGNVEVSSTPGKGSTFSLNFPIRRSS